jgi:hypothetical protein
MMRWHVLMCTRACDDLETGTGKQCRERWHNQLDPNIKKEGWSEEEDRILLHAHTELGNHWVEISKVLTRARADCHALAALASYILTSRVIAIP